MVSKEVEPVYISTSNVQEFQLLFLPTFGIVNLFHFKHSGGYVVGLIVVLIWNALFYYESNIFISVRKFGKCKKEETKIVHILPSSSLLL